MPYIPKPVLESELPGVTQVAISGGVSTSQVSRLVKNKCELTKKFENDYVGLLGHPVKWDIVASPEPSRLVASTV